MSIFANNILTYTHTTTCVKQERVHLVFNEANSETLPCTNTEVSEGDIGFLLVTLIILFNISPNYP